MEEYSNMRQWAIFFILLISVIFVNKVSWNIGNNIWSTNNNIYD